MVTALVRVAFTVSIELMISIGSTASLVIIYRKLYDSR